MTQLALAFADVPAPRRRTGSLEHFHPTGQGAEEALAGERRAQRQEIRVADWFRSKPAGFRATPWDVAAALGLCINSARRAMSNATAAGVLVDHPEDRRPAGEFGQRSRTWSLRGEP